MYIRQTYIANRWGEEGRLARDLGTTDRVIRSLGFPFASHTADLLWRSQKLRTPADTDRSKGCPEGQHRDRGAMPKTQTGTLLLHSNPAHKEKPPPTPIPAKAKWGAHMAALASLQSEQDRGHHCRPWRYRKDHEDKLWAMLYTNIWKHRWDGPSTCIAKLLQFNQNKIDTFNSFITQGHWIYNFKTPLPKVFKPRWFHWRNRSNVLKI